MEQEGDQWVSRTHKTPPPGWRPVSRSERRHTPKQENFKIKSHHLKYIHLGSNSSKNWAEMLVSLNPSLEIQKSNTLKYKII